MNEFKAAFPETPKFFLRIIVAFRSLPRLSKKAVNGRFRGHDGLGARGLSHDSAFQIRA
jgi:hypothetical protein